MKGNLPFLKSKIDLLKQGIKWSIQNDKLELSFIRTEDGNIIINTIGKENFDNIRTALDSLQTVNFYCQEDNLILSPADFSALIEFYEQQPLDYNSSISVVNELEETQEKKNGSMKTSGPEKLFKLKDAKELSGINNGTLRVSDNKYSIINNPGGGDCGVYALIDAIHGSESQYDIQEEIRSNITNTIKNFILLYSTLEEYAKNLDNPPSQEIIVDLYKNIFGQGGFRNFKFIVKNKLKAPLEDEDTNAETRASLESKINLVNDIDDWDLLREVPQDTL